MLKISIINNLDIKKQESYLSKCVIITSANYISKSKKTRGFISEKYILYNNMQIKRYANIILKQQTRKYAIITSIYNIGQKKKET